MVKHNFKIVTVGMTHFSEDQLLFISKNMNMSPSEFVKKDSENRLKIRGTEKESKIKERADSAYDEHFWALQSEYVIINPHGEDDKDAWNNRIYGVELVIKQFCDIVNKYKNQKLFLILNGPSCVGKGPLENVFFNEIAPKEKLKIEKCILTVDDNRPPRPSESDGNPYYFRTREEIDTNCTKEPYRYIPFYVRSVKQMIDLEQVNEKFMNNDIVFLEIYYSAIPILKTLV
jgi:guanylate kinase